MASGATQLSELKQSDWRATLSASGAETRVLTTAERFNSIPGAFGVANCRIVRQPEVGQANRGCGHENGDIGQVDCWVRFRSVNMANCGRPYRPCSQHACPNIDFRDQRVVDGAFLGDLLQL
jgi:hypothetical protein